MAQQLSFSFELFPPRTPESAARLPTAVKKLASVQPKYFSVTFGAGGSTQAGTYETVVQVVRDTGIEAAPHLTCVGSTREKIRDLLDQYKAAGIRRIVALRGDLPGAAPGASAGANNSFSMTPAHAAGSEAPGEFRYANELVAFIRETHGNDFRVEVACYPEMHPQATDPNTDFENFERKAKSGADTAITQYFFNPQAYFDFVNRSRRAGLTLPVIAGIMPITNFIQLARFSDACGADIPRWIRLRLERLQHDKVALQDFGLDVVTQLCETLLAGGAPGLHFYTLNQSEPTLRLWRNLGLPA